METDLPFLLEVRNECRGFLHDDREFTLDECELWYRRSKPEFWLIRYAKEPIGYFRVSNRNEAEGSAYVGADLHCHFRGRGLAKAAYAEFLTLLRRRDNLRVARLEVLSHNLAARRLYELIGFTEIDRKEAVAVRNGTPVDSIVMEKRL